MFFSDGLVACLVAFAIVGGCSLLSPQPDVDRLVEISLSQPQDVLAKSEYELSIKINNQSAREIRVAGLTWC
jgi:hypothetical protein